MLNLLGAQWLGQEQTVGAQGSGPRKKFLPGWLTRKGEGYEQEVPGQDFDDRATGNGGVQRSTVGESALDQLQLDQFLRKGEESLDGTVAALPYGPTAAGAPFQCRK
jgi:hypothetical protein